MLGAVVVVVLVGRAAVLGVVEAHVLVRLYVGKSVSHYHTPSRELMDHTHSTVHEKWTR